MSRVEDAKKILSEVKHPEINASLVELGMIGNIEDVGDKLIIELKLPFPGVPILGMLTDLIVSSLKKNGMEAEVKTGVMSDDERNQFMRIENEKWAL
ncbi:MAG: DUF59 domain-containing protein [Candidatus Aenigmarchaeota archaeon]|nr:DUF59 domain-containing protein [Candidatus Aenigmarchaeota archaeon]